MAPQSPTHLHRYFGEAHGFWLARWPVCPDHGSPLEFAARAYLHSDARLFALAAKGTGKTQALSLLHVANSRFKPGCWTAHMGASLGQADGGYEYFVHEVTKPEFRDEIDGEALRKRTDFKNGSRVEILSGTIAGASGPHEQVGCVDELDQLDYDVWQHFNKTPHEASGIPAQLILASTRFIAYGTVNRVLEDLGANLTTIAWCVWDAMRPCKYGLDGCVVPGMGRCPMYSRKTVMPDGTVDDVPMCVGKAAKADGHLTWAEVYSGFVTSDAQSFDILQCLKQPGREGMFYPECDDLVHVSAEHDYVAGREVYLGYDYGFEQPLALGAWQVRSDGLVYQFDEIYTTKKLTWEICEELAAKPWFRDIHLGWPDPSAHSDIEEFRRFFLKHLGRAVMVWDTDNDRVDGWRVLRRRLRSQLGVATIGFNRRCVNTWKDIKGLVRKEGTEDCEKRTDHGANQARYLVRNLERYVNVQAAYASDEGRPTTGPDRETRMKEQRTELAVKERWDRLRQLGVREERLREVEQRYPDGDEFARALGQWIADTTLKGRLQRAGLSDDEPFEDEDD